MYFPERGSNWLRGSQKPAKGINSAPAFEKPEIEWVV